MKRIFIAAAAVAVACAGALLVPENDAEACGCVSPPEVGDDIAINQSAEQIIFEVEEGLVTAHVLIRYTGKPSEFAWIVPVPSVPELSLSPESAFALLDDETRPTLSLSTKNECPESAWQCSYAELPICASGSGGGGGGCGFSGGGGEAGDPDFTQDASSNGALDAGATGEAPAVEVLNRAVIGSYETIVFSAGDIAGAVAWLQNEGFIVNSTMAPYMQPYADAGMLFLASKLVPGANTTDIKPLRMRFAADKPMIPLQLTAVAAEPDMTITTYVYGATAFTPKDFPLAEIDAEQLSVDSNNRSNYPMLLRKAVDEAGGKSFIAEYSGSPVVIDFDQGTGCCTSDFDICNIAFDGICSCPGNDFDADDCADTGDLAAGADLLAELAGKHAVLTRLTTRMSAEDMSYDPVFEPNPEFGAFGNLVLSNQLTSLSACEGAIIDSAHYDEIVAMGACSSVYCGTGSCVLTASGAACECAPGTTSRRFIDLDGRSSVTCVPDESPVDLAAGGIEVPDACGGVDCGAGSCVDVGAFPTCQCDAGYAGAQEGLEAAPKCEAILAHSGGHGADNFTKPLASLPVCAPPPPDCGEFGWNTPISNFNGKAGIACAYSVPSAAELVPVAAPTCEQRGLRDESSGCSTDSTTSLSGFGLFGLVFLFAFRRRQRQ